MNVNNTAASATMNMNMTFIDRGIYCRKVLWIISIIWHALLSLSPSLSFSNSIYFSLYFSPSLVIFTQSSFRHDRNVERSPLSPAEDFLPSGFYDLSSSFYFNGCHWHHSWTILAEHQKPLSPSIPLFLSALQPLFWISSTFCFFFFYFIFSELNLHQSWTSLKTRLSQLHTHRHLPTSSFSDFQTVSV